MLMLQRQKYIAVISYFLLILFNGLFITIVCGTAQDNSESSVFRWIGLVKMWFILMLWKYLIIKMLICSTKQQLLLKDIISNISELYCLKMTGPLSYVLLSCVPLNKVVSPTPGNLLAFLHFWFPLLKVDRSCEWIFSWMPTIRSVVTKDSIEISNWIKKHLHVFKIEATDEWSKETTKVVSCHHAEQGDSFTH